MEQPDRGTATAGDLGADAPGGEALLGHGGVSFWAAAAAAGPITDAAARQHGPAAVRHHLRGGEHGSSAGMTVPFTGRREDQRLLTGAGRFTADWNLSGQLHGVFLRAEHAHAAIKGLDASAALAAPGIAAV